MSTADDDIDPVASTTAADPMLQRLRKAVMSRLFDEASEPERIGRYEIVRVLGSGAMGAVFAAHDPELDRQVAVKLLHVTNHDAEGKRLLREAKALARLSHPNVVQVHDAGATEDRVFLAMELVQGTDLHRWLRARPRGWREVLDVFVAAGRGLAAAHAVGLVHRDFKPQNVLVGEGGEVKVADFGLVRAAEGPAALGPAPSEAALDVAVESLTKTGAVIGTPAYMAPEQHLVLATDARTDQFSFCVALYEGLVGERPFRADTLRGLIDAVRSDRVEFPPRPWLPAALRRALRRGLHADPADRFPDMAALLDALDRARRPAWPRWALGATAVGLVALVAGRLLPGSEAPAEAPAAAVRAEACDAEAKASSIWGDDARERVRAHLVGVNPELGERAAVTAIQAIDGYLGTWSEAYASTCEAEPTIDEAQVLARRLCLQSRLQEARGVISVLEQADAAIVADVPQIVAALEPVAQCQGELAVVRTASAANDELSFELARVRSLWHARRPVEAYAATEALAKRAGEAGDRMLESDAWLLAGMIAEHDLFGYDRWGRLRPALTAALAAAQALGDPTRALRAEVMLAGATGDGDFAAELARLERLAARVEASADPLAKWAYHHELSWSFVNPDDASSAEHARRMLAIATESFGPGHRLARLSQHAARVRGVLPQPTAEQQRDQAAEVAAMFGTESLRAAEELEELASRLEREGRPDEARLELERAVVIWTTLLGPKSTQVGAAWRRIGNLEVARSNHETALVAFDRAIDALEANPVSDHDGEIDVLASVWGTRAEILLELGRGEEAVAAIEQAKSLRHVKEVHEVSGELFGRARLAAGDPEGALAELAAARKSTPAQWVPLDITEGEALLALGRAKAARTRLREAWNRLAPTGNDSFDRFLRVRTGLALARALAAIDTDDPQIATIATAALASMPTEYSSPSLTRMRDALIELRE